ncbi:MAG: oligosaccharide flippase family protein [Eubacteriales bacterium]|nr:oligosaccharide flippase family protein [Eubacteriales bacterium]MDD4475996.1 oligosaccharide flippase family protein [Eubacteriales bacterium]
MVKVISRISDFFTIGDKRTLNAKKNISVAFICKGVSIIVSFLIVPLTLGYVGKVEYGIWMIISSIIHWFSFFDIGLGNGLRNKLAEALALNDKEQAKIYVSSVFALILLISTVMFVAFFIAANFISWNKVLNTDLVANNELLLIVVMVFFFFCIEFVLKVVSSVLQAMQKYAVNDIIGLSSQILGLLAIYILVKTTDGSLFNLCLVYGGKSAVVWLIATVVLFFTILKELRPSIQFVKIKQALPLLNLGVRFFIAQILYIILTQSSVIIIAQFFGPSDVTTYNLSVRYMTIPSMVYMMVLTPFLSAFTEAYTKKEDDWIKKTLSKINKVWLITTLVTVLFVVFYKLFFKLWVGNEVVVPFYLIACLCVFSLFSSWSSTYTLFLNGVGKIKLQIYVMTVQACLFIPLSYLFFKCGFELASIVVVQIIFYAISSLVFTLQYKKIVNSTAIGIWNK